MKGGVAVLAAQLGAPVPPSLLLLCLQRQLPIGAHRRVAIPITVKGCRCGGHAGCVLGLRCMRPALSTLPAWHSCTVPACWRYCSGPSLLAAGCCPPASPHPTAAPLHAPCTPSHLHTLQASLQVLHRPGSGGQHADSVPLPGRRGGCGLHASLTATRFARGHVGWGRLPLCQTAVPAHLPRLSSTGAGANDDARGPGRQAAEPQRPRQERAAAAAHPLVGRLAVRWAGERAVLGGMHALHACHSSRYLGGGHPDWLLGGTRLQLHVARPCGAVGGPLRADPGRYRTPRHLRYQRAHGGTAMPLPCHCHATAHATAAVAACKLGLVNPAALPRVT